MFCLGAMRRLLFQKICLILSDFISIVLTYWVSIQLANCLESQRLHYFGTHHMVLIKIMNIFAIIALLWSSELYTKRRPTWEELRITYRQILYVLVLDFIIITLSRNVDSVTYLFFFMYWSLLFIILPLIRMFMIRILLHYRLWQRRVYIVGVGDLALDAYRLLKGRRQMGLELRAFINLDDDYSSKSIHVDGRDVRVCSFAELFTKNRSAEIVIALDSAATELNKGKIFLIQRSFNFVSLVPDFNGLSLYGIEVNHFFGKEQLLLRLENNLSRRLNRSVKFVFDLCIILICLPVVLPLMLIIMLGVYLEDRGNPFFIQPRIGKDGDIFGCIKFRTMHKNAEKIMTQWQEENNPLYYAYVANNFKLENDPRVTRIGRILRKTSLDELGQLLNILKFDMSLVGPRPLLLSELNVYDDGMFYYGEVRPGITGMWQVSGRSKTSFADRCRLDTWYIKNWSLWYDVVILIKTFEVVLKRDGAY